MASHTQSPRDVMPIAEIARRIDRSETTIRKWITDGVFPGYRYGSAYVVPCPMYEQWLRGEWTPRAPEQQEEAA